MSEQKSGLISVSIKALKILLSWLALPLGIWKDSCDWIADYQGSSSITKDKIRVLPVLEASLQALIFFSWVIGVLVTLVTAIGAASGFGGGAGAFFAALVTGLISTYFLPFIFALTRELVAVLVRLVHKLDS